MASLKIKTPNLTPNRYVGKPCPKCGNKVRMKKKAACCVCLRKKHKIWALKVGYYKRPHIMKRSNIRGAKQVRRIKEEVLKAYGNKCECCGEKCILFLTIDHITPLRRATSKTKESGAIMYRKLKRLGFPKKNHRVLCFNCNCGRQVNHGVCPHKGVIKRDWWEASK